MHKKKFEPRSGDTIYRLQYSEQRRSRYPIALAMADVSRGVTERSEGTHGNEKKILSHVVATEPLVVYYGLEESLSLRNEVI